MREGSSPRIDPLTPAAAANAHFDARAIPRADPPPIFIGGAGRSGTTLLRVVLDSHSRIACGPELKVIPSIACLWADFHTKWAPYLADSRVQGDDIDQVFGRLIVSLLEPLRRSAGKPRVAEKSPNNVFFFPHLHRMFPDAAFLHMLRDGRDVVASLLTMNWRTPDGTPIDYTRDARLAARYWARAVSAGREFARMTAGSSHYREVRYEDLLDDPQAYLRALFDFLGEPWEPAVLAYHTVPRTLGDESSAAQVAQPLNRASAGRWQRELAPADRQAVKEEIGDLLIELGYARDHDW
jgi:hypothetical protein